VVANDEVSEKPNNEDMPKNRKQKRDIAIQSYEHSDVRVTTAKDLPLNPAGVP